MTRIFEGANDVLRLHLAGEALLWPTAEMAALPPLADGLPAPLREAATQNHADLGEILAAVAAVRKQHGMKAIERQATLARIGGMALAVYAARVTLLRAAGEIAEAGGDCPAADLAQVACQIAHESFLAARAGLADPEGAAAERVARRELARVGS